MKPPRQDNYEIAKRLGFEALRGQCDEQLLWLGAERSGDAWRLAVLGDWLEVDMSRARVTTSAGREVSAAWGILALHYLAVASRPERCAPDTTFAELPASRAYAGVYDQRVIGRLCRTAGRDAETLSAEAQALGGRAAEGGDLAFDFDEFPRVPLRLVWHAPDDEFPPSATLLLPRNIESFFCTEDIVVLSESLVSRLGGRLF